MMDDAQLGSQDVARETPAEDVFRPPSVDSPRTLNGLSYSYYSDVPMAIRDDTSTGCVLGVDEAGRGPVLGPMVYAVFYLPQTMHESLLAETHHFDDSKVLTPETRSALMRTLCTAGSDLHAHCGWATQVMSARDIGAGMLRAAGAYNLNAQAMDATVELIKGVFDRGVNVTDIFVDTIGNPAAYQKKLERVFPTARLVVAKKADSLYPCVSAASVCAKVTRDAALEVSYESYAGEKATSAEGWGSGYPSDARTSSWLKADMDPVFGWGPECRFSWGTSKELLEAKDKGLKVDWPVEGEDDGMKMTDFFVAATDAAIGNGEDDELVNWFGRKVNEKVF